VNALNRLVLLIVALLLVAVPVLLLLVHWGIIQAEVVDQYTGYTVAVQALGDFQTSALTTGARVVIAVVGALVALIALLLLLRELTLGRRVSRSTVMDDTPPTATPTWCSQGYRSPLLITTLISRRAPGRTSRGCWGTRACR
jgi:hypothetical protein